MDKAAKIILGIAIAIIYPVLVFIAVLQIFPTSEETREYPTYPSCSTGRSSRTYNYQTRSYDYNYNYEEDNARCEAERDAYDDKVKEYNKAQDHELVLRSIVGLVIGLLTVVGIYFVRDVRELAGGITAGASLVVITATGTLSGLGGDSDLKGVIVFLILLAFAVLTFVLKMVDLHVHNEDVQPIQPGVTATAPPEDET